MGYNQNTNDMEDDMTNNTTEKRSDTLEIVSVETARRGYKEIALYLQHMYLKKRGVALTPAMIQGYAETIIRDNGWEKSGMHYYSAMRVMQREVMRGSYRD